MYRTRHAKSLMVITLYDDTIIMCVEVEKTRKSYYYKSLPLEESMIVHQFKVKSVESLTEFYCRQNKQPRLINFN